MEAGYDYTLVRAYQLRQRFIRFTGLLLVLFGLAVLAISAGYYIYSFQARSSLDGLVYTGPVLTDQRLPAAVPQTEVMLRDLVAVQDPVRHAPMEPVAVGVTNTTIEALPPAAIMGNIQETAILNHRASFAPVDIPFVTIYPGEIIPTRFWANPLGMEHATDLQSAFTQGFQPTPGYMAPPPGTLSTATRIQIPIIGLDSRIEPLRILDVGESRAYETPKWVVGHISETANPGENGTGWFFGHLESPILGEGSVFRQLPELPQYLRQGESVYLILDGNEGSYLYQVTKTEVVHESELQVQNLNRPSVVLVTCIPKLIYDHRLVVTAELVGIKS